MLSIKYHFRIISRHTDVLAIKSMVQCVARLSFIGHNMCILWLNDTSQRVSDETVGWRW